MTDLSLQHPSTHRDHTTSACTVRSVPCPQDNRLLRVLGAGRDIALFWCEYRGHSSCHSCPSSTTDPSDRWLEPEERSSISGNQGMTELFVNGDLNKSYTHHRQTILIMPVSKRIKAAWRHEIYTFIDSIYLLFAPSKRSSYFFISITSVQNVRWGEGVQGQCTFFPKFKN